MAALPHKFLHISGPKAVALAAHINGAASNADVLCRSGFAYPVAIELARQMAAGVGNVTALHLLGFSGTDAIEIAAQIATRGPH
jgi:4-aminobutyrate aminotransferase-like enzyme